MARAKTSMSGYSDQEAATSLRSDPGFFQASNDPMEATAQTIKYMCQLIDDSMADGIVQKATQDADRFRAFGRTPYASIWWWVKHSVKFVHHSKLLAQWMDAPDELQLLIRPDALLKMERPKGDCAVFTTLICAMLNCAGVKWEIVTVAVDPRALTIPSHVYPRAVLPNGQRIPLDASHGKWPGWEVPWQRVSGRQIWDSAGNQIADLDTGYKGLHGYGGDGMYPGLGQDCCLDYDDSGNCLEEDPTCGGTSTPVSPVLSSPVSTFNPSDCAYGGVYPNCSPAPTTSQPIVINQLPGTTAAPVALTPQQTQALSQFGSQLTATIGATQGVNSSMVYNPLTGQYQLVTNAANSTNPLSLLSTASSSTWLVLGGLVIGGILLMSLVGKK